LQRDGRKPNLEIMKKVLAIMILSAALVGSCQKEEPFMDVGIITGPDLRLCACCGGWFINIGNDTYRFMEIPCNCSLDLVNAEFPVIVNIDWEEDPNPCLGDEITVHRIRKK